MLRSFEQGDETTGFVKGTECVIGPAVQHITVYFDYTNINLTNKYTFTKNTNHQQMHRVLSSIVTHSYMFRPCWVIFRENFFVIITLRLHFIVE
jgi:hypothetical protein